MTVIQVLEALGALLVHAISWLAACHALLTKRDPRSALGWSAAVLLLPLIGPLIYAVFGISRAESRATKIMHEQAALEPEYAHPPLAAPAQKLPDANIYRMEYPGRSLTGQHLLPGNRLEPLVNGDAAYPAMLKAIGSARRHVFLTTYIFNGGKSGEAFSKALGQAAQRGVDVRLLMDGVGQYYSLTRPWRRCSSQGVRTALFMPPQLIPPHLAINLRNHRKLLICDDVGFTGGMNIADNNYSTSHRRVQDVHFRCEGPIVGQLVRAFLLNWGFATGEYSPLPSMPAAMPGNSFCRLVMDGPGNGLDVLNDLYCGVINTAHDIVRIMTPYFLPSHDLMASLRSAAQRKVDVRVLLPAKNNLPYVHWATFHLLPTLLTAGVRIWFRPPPFAHTKLMTIDGYYSQVGSSNLDARSLRLNFELNMEVFDRELHDRLAQHFDAVQDGSHEITQHDLDAMSLPKRLRNAACWTFSPYL